MGFFGPSAEEIADVFANRKYEDELRRLNDIAHPFGLKISSTSPSGRAWVELDTNPRLDDPEFGLSVEVETVGADQEMLKQMLRHVARQFADQYLNHLLGDNSLHPRIGWIKRHLRGNG